MKKIWVLISAGIAVVALIAGGIVLSTNTPTPKDSEKPIATKTADPTALDDLGLVFDPGNISDIYIEVPEKSEVILDKPDRDQYAHVKIQFTVGTKKSPLMDVAMKIKGTTSRAGINSTWRNASFKVKFNYDDAHKKQRFLGLKSITLNAMVQDGSKIHETFAYETYRAMGVPSSRTGFGNITFSKNITNPKRGLYLVLESLDDVFLASNFSDITQHLYENNHNFMEFSQRAIGGNREINDGYQVKEGWKDTPNRNDLRAFARIADKEPKEMWDGLETISDREKLIMLFAVDNFTGGWDTYSGPIKNNYQMRSNTQGVFTFLPWGLDNTWGENWFNDVESTTWVKDYVAPIVLHDDYFFPVDTASAGFPGGFMIAANAGITDNDKRKNYQMTRGMIFRKCLAYSPCATEYFQDLRKIVTWAKTSDLAGRMVTTASMIEKYSSDFNKAEQKRTSKWVGKQIKRIEKAIAKHCKLDANNEITSCK